MVRACVGMTRKCRERCWKEGCRLEIGASFQLWTEFCFTVTVEAGVGALGSRIHTVPSTLLGALYTLSHSSLHLIPIVQIEKH